LDTLIGKMEENEPRGGWRAEVDPEGRLIFPPELARRYGLKPGAKIRMEEAMIGFRMRQPVTHLAKVYIEPTNCCNLECRTCIRNTWDEPMGKMSPRTFTRILEGLRSFSPVPSVFFGGFGEPLSHPDIMKMITQTKALGASVEMITNGTLLTREMSRRLIESELDMLWVSVDGATPESYADVRLGAVLPEVISNLIALREERWGVEKSMPGLGFVFVAMKRNIHDLPAVMRMGYYLGVKRFLVTNVLAYSKEMSKEILYERTVTSATLRGSLKNASLKLPKMDLNEVTREALYAALRGGQSTSYAEIHFDEGTDFCPFIESGATVVTWDGNISPCMALLRNHVSYFDGRERFSRRYIVGNVTDRPLQDLWNDVPYLAFRERIQTFDFSCCTSCGGCELAEANEEDCFGNKFPTCGGCLWAQGVIRCP
jgi:MoaA/NifB/PqqE/SkfB family radical SAM enzyme